MRNLIHEIFVVKFELPEPSVRFAHRKQEDGVDGLSDYPNALIFEPGDVDGLAGALARVLQDGALRAQLSERGRRRAGRFSWTRCAAGLAELYRDAAG